MCYMVQRQRTNQKQSFQDQFSQVFRPPSHKLHSNVSFQLKCLAQWKPNYFKNQITFGNHDVSDVFHRHAAFTPCYIWRRECPPCPLRWVWELACVSVFWVCVCVNALAIQLRAERHFWKEIMKKKSRGNEIIQRHSQHTGSAATLLCQKIRRELRTPAIYGTLDTG